MLRQQPNERDTTMQKLLATFAENYHYAPRVALLRYLARHPMAECLVTPADAELIALARDHARDDAEYAYYQRINA